MTNAVGADAHLAVTDRPVGILDHHVVSKPKAFSSHPERGSRILVAKPAARWPDEDYRSWKALDCRHEEYFYYI